MEVIPEEHKEAHAEWLKSSRGNLFWDEMKEMMEAYRNQACRVNPVDPSESYDVFMYKKLSNGAMAHAIDGVLQYREQFLEDEKR